MPCASPRAGSPRSKRRSEGGLGPLSGDLVSIRCQVMGRHIIGSSRSLDLQAVMNMFCCRSHLEGYLEDVVLQIAS